LLYYIIRAILLPFLYLFYRPRVSGLENIPKEGSVIIYSNHTSLLDPIVLGCMLHRRIYFMAKQELFRFPPMKALLLKLGAFPVKRGSADLSAIKKALQTLKEGKVFGIFPEGTRSRSGSLQDFNHGTAAIAHKSRAVTIPVAILNGYRLFQPVRVVIGKPLDFETYYSQRSSSELLEKMSADMSRAVLDIVPNQ
jgi:1-acyl-sn-glycerol-3-phosphate acyltransferase